MAYYPSKPSFSLKGLALGVLYIGGHWLFLPFEYFALFMLANFVAVTIHELAHLVVAWRSKFQIDEISIGIGPPAVRFTLFLPKAIRRIYMRRDRERFREVKISVSGIPLGGFVTFYREPVTSGNRYRAFHPRAMPHTALVLISLAGPAANLLAVLLGMATYLVLEPGVHTLFEVLWIVTTDHLKLLLFADWSAYARMFDNLNYYGLTPVMAVIYIIQLNMLIAMLNLLPFPTADGGWAFRSLVEKYLGEEPYWLVGAMWGCTIAWLLATHLSAAYWVFLAG